jgi:hypothetical protein
MVKFKGMVSGEFWQNENYRSVYQTVYLDRSCLFSPVTKTEITFFLLEIFLEI